MKTVNDKEQKVKPLAWPTMNTCVHYFVEKTSRAHSFCGIGS